MRKISKIIGLFLIVSVLFTAFISCKNSDNSTADGNGNTSPVVDDDVIYSPYVDTTIILGEGVEADDVKAIRNEYYKIVGKEVLIKNADAEPSDHEIIIGKTDREISERAYRNLELNNSDQEKIGYLIYSDGKSIAIAFDEAAFGENVAFAEAIDCLIEKYMTKSSLKLDTGIAFLECFYPIERQNERDAQDSGDLWNLKYSQILARLDNVDGNEEKVAAIVEELKSLSSIYNNDYSTVIWLANLYDPETGGFYHSNSARNNEGYAPDLGSTSEALYLTELILGGYGGTLTDYFGEEIANKFVSFVKNMQDPNGYFYHPQWNRDLIDKTPGRKNIDVTNALSILEAFGASPTYDTPNGVKGDGLTASVSKLTTPLKTSTVSAVSQVVSSVNDEIYIPSYMKSEESFTTYLSSLNIKSDVSGVCQTLLSELPVYIAVDEILEENGENYRLCDILKSFLDRNKSYTGLWIEDLDPTYEEIGELVDVIKIYNGLGAVIPNYDTTLKIILHGMHYYSEPNNISDIADLWSALAYTVNNIRTYSSEFYMEQVNTDIKEIYFEFDNLLNMSAEKLRLFAKPDGSFASTLEGSEYLSYDMSVAVPLTDEGDIKATLIATKDIWLSVFSVLGIGDVPIFNTSDRMMFQKTLLDMGVIIKNEVIKTPPEDFESYEEYSEAELKSQKFTSVDSYQQIIYDSEEHGNALRLYSGSDNGTDEFYLSPINSVRSATCYSYDVDLKVLPEQDTGTFAHLFLYRYMHLVTLERVGDEIRFIERTNAWEDTGYYTDLGVRVNVGEWFNLRVEYYSGNRETVRVKIFINDKCVAVTDNFYAKQSSTAYPSTNFEGLAIMSLRNKEMSLLLDNFLCESSYKTYIAENSKDLVMNVDTPDKKQDVYTFDDSVAGSTPAGFNPGGEASAVTVMTDTNGNNVLAVTEKAGEIILPIDQRGVCVNSAVVEFDFIVDNNSATGSKYQISFNEYLYKERLIGALQLMVVEEGGNKYVTVAEVTTAGKTGTVYSNVKLSLDIKYTLKLHIFYKEKAMVVSIDDEIVGINANILDGAEKYNMRETTITALTSSKSSAVYIDNLVSEKVVGDYEEAINPEIPRVEYNFDTTDEIEIFGIEVIDGVLSFNDVNRIEGYIKIPVNKRVYEPTLSVVNMDILKAEKAYGEIVIKITDKEGNIVVALAVVRNDNIVEIHEYTENGIYPTPIYTTEAESFNLSIRYNEAKQGYNLYIDGAYATSSSLIYNETSGSYEFEYLYITAEVSTGLSIDNLYAEQVCDFLVTDAPASTNSDNKSEVLTFEQSSFASLPSKISTIFNAEGSVLNIKEQKIDGAVNKVLEFYAGAKNEIVLIEKTQTVADTNAAFFETELMIRSYGGKAGVSFSPQTYVNGTYPYLVDLVLSVSDVGEAVKLSLKGIDDVLLDVTEGEWFKVRFEYAATEYDYDYDGKNNAVIRAYINGVLVAEGYKLREDSLNATPAKGIFRTKIVAEGKGSAFFNNTIQGQCNMEYEAPAPADTDTLTFNPGIITYQTEFELDKTTSTSKIIDLADTADAVNKVLEFYTSASSADKMSVIVTQENADANAIMFETDIMITPESDTATFYLEPVNSKGKYPFRLSVKATKGGAVTISASDIPETVIGQCGEWIHLKVEYMSPLIDYTGDGIFDILYKVYVGDDTEPLATGYKPYSTSSYYNPLTLVKFVFETEADTEATILFDNTRYWQVTLTPDEAPEGGNSSSGSGSMGGSEDTTLDNDGWI